MNWGFSDRFGQKSDWRAEFASAINAYRIDKYFSLPTKAKEALHRTDQPNFVLLGTKDFGSSFAKSVEGLFEINYAVDDFKCHKGQRFHGAPIISTDRFLLEARKNPNIIAINTCRYDYSRRYFEQLCNDNEILILNFEQAIRLMNLNNRLDYRLQDWASAIESNQEQYEKLASRLCDPYSIDTLFSVLLFHLTCDPEWYLNFSRPYTTLYFRSGLFALGENESLVDCGASIGESTTAFIDAARGKIKHSWMIEPDKYNVETLEDFIRKYQGSGVEEKLSLHPVAVGSEKTVVGFNHVGWHGGSIVANSKGNGEVQVMRIEDIVDTPPSIIKMDIEGAELEALHGATGVIKGYRPKLLLSAYHRSTDLIEIPKFVENLRDDYRIGLRHHTEDRWDTCLYFY